MGSRERQGPRPVAAAARESCSWRGASGLPRARLWPQRQQARSLPAGRASGTAPRDARGSRPPQRARGPAGGEVSEHANPDSATALPSRDGGVSARQTCRSTRRRAKRTANEAAIAGQNERCAAALRACWRWGHSRPPPHHNCADRRTRCRAEQLPEARGRATAAAPSIEGQARARLTRAEMPKGGRALGDIRHHEAAPAASASVASAEARTRAESELFFSRRCYFSPVARTSRALFLFRLFSGFIPVFLLVVWFIGDRAAGSSSWRSPVA